MPYSNKLFESRIVKREGTSFTLSCKHLKLLNEFTYLGSSVSSTENDVHICLAKAWTAIHRLSIIWRSNLSDKKKDFFQAVCFNTTVWFLNMDANKSIDNKIYKNATNYIEQILETKPHQTAPIRLLTSHLKNHSSKTNKTSGALLERQGRTQK